MKLRRVLSFAVSTVLLIAGAAIATRKPARAQSTNPGCSVQTLSGAYGFDETGYFFTPQGYGIASAVGRIVADGNGNITGIETTSTDGTVTRGVSFGGGYQVNADCTGAVQFQAQGVTTNVDIVIVNGGASMKFIHTDSGLTLTGTATKQ